MPEPPPSRPPALGLFLADLAMAVLCVTAMFWLLASPLIPIVFTPGALIAATFALGLPLGGVGIVLNHMAARSPSRRPPRRTR